MPVQVVSPPRLEEGRQRRTLLIFLMQVAAIALAALVVFALLEPNPWQARAFQAYSPLSAAGMNDAKAGQTVYALMTDPQESQPGWVTLHGAAPHGLSNSTGASFSYYLCTLRPGPQLDGFARVSDVARTCSRLAAADDATMSLTRQQIWVAVTPSHAGVVAFRGLDVHYTQDGHDGSQRTGPDIRIRVD